MMNHHYQIYEGFGAIPVPANDNGAKVVGVRSVGPNGEAPADFGVDEDGALWVSPVTKLEFELRTGKPWPESAWARTLYLLPAGYRGTGIHQTAYHGDFGALADPLPDPQADRKGRYIRTATGRRFWPHDPRSEDIYPEDIAYALARLQRYGGHASKVYSVAEHCVLGADRILEAGGTDYEAFDFLLHDAPEALGFVDVPAPTKSQLPDYVAAEHKCWRAVAKRFGLGEDMLPGTKSLDKLMSSDEMQQVMQGLEPGMAPGVGIKLRNWGPADAQWNWLHRFERLYLAVHGKEWVG